MEVIQKLSLENVFRSILIEEYEKDKIWFHGSNKKIDKFFFDFRGNNDRISNYYGYGIYFINDVDKAKKYGDVVTKVLIKDGADILKYKVTIKQLYKVYNQFKKENFKLTKYQVAFYENPHYDEYSVLNSALDFYDSIFYGNKDYFKEIKDVSLFLARSGIDGMEVKNDVGDEILVVFNEDVIRVI